MCYHVLQVKGGVLKKSLQGIKIQFGLKVILKIKINKSYDTECSKSYFSFNSILQLKKINIFVNLRKKNLHHDNRKKSGFPSSVEKTPRCCDNRYPLPNLIHPQNFIASNRFHPFFIFYRICNISAVNISKPLRVFFSAFKLTNLTF